MKSESIFILSTVSVDFLATTPEESNTKAEAPKSSEDMFNKMEHQYEVARAVTHSYRGVGLGFAKPF